MIIDCAFKPAWWLSNRHAQTIFPTLMRRLIAPIDQVERIELPDGDFVELAWAINGLDADAPLVILIHGLGGGIHSPYVAGQLQAFNRQGWRAALLCLRGASEEPNRLPRAYHSGDTNDLHVVLETLAKREPETKKAIVGVSLGGNVLLKWLGEQSEQDWMHAAVAVSVPFVLSVVADRIHQGLSRGYQIYLLRRMRQLFQRKSRISGQLSKEILQELNHVSCFWTFDDRITAPLHGFPNVHAYYRESSSRQFLSRISTPTLIIHALDDPFMSPEIVPTADELSESICLELSQKGGHVGFITGDIPGKPIYWLDQRIPEYLQSYLN